MTGGALARPRLDLSRVLVLAATLVLLAAPVSVLYRIVGVDGDPTLMLALAGAALVAATGLARFVRVRVAVTAATVLLAGALVAYSLSLPNDPRLLELLENNLELLTGKSLASIRRSTVWGVAVAPAPVFVTWYLALRGWYASAALVGATLLGYFVLTGDASLAVTLAGVIAVAALLGVGDLDRREWSVGALEYVAIVLAVMVVAPAVVSVIPGGATTPLSFEGGGSGSIEATLLESGSEVPIRGSIELSPTVRFTVESPEQRYWRASSYDRYTGDGWVRTGSPRTYAPDEVGYPPGSSRRITQEFRAETRIDTMPAAWRPVRVGSGAADRALVDTTGGLQPARPFAPGENYTVTSAVPAVSAAGLSNTGTDYPDRIADRYLQLPDGTPDRVRERTAAITAEADDPYATTLAVRDWLLANREYSLEVDRPGGDVADAFLFEMEAGYCVYYATTMATMLRTQGIPARMTVGYTTGQQVAENTYVVRGYNSHAWVEVYFEGVGWVPFDPTPAGPRVAAEQAQLDRARSEGDVEDVDTSLSTPGTRAGPVEVPGVEATPADTTPANPADLGDGLAPGEAVDVGATDPSGGSGGFSLPALPSATEVGFGALLVAGAVAGLRRSGLGERAYRAAWLRAQRRSDPRTDVEGAYRRAMYVLERRHRPRRPGETVRAYLDAVDAGPAARRIAAIRERACYADGIDEAAADEALDLLDRLRRRG